MKKLLSLMFFVLLCVASPLDTQAEGYIIRLVETNQLPLKASPSPSAATIDTLQKGEAVYRSYPSYVQNGWLYVHHDGQNGYVNAGLLNKANIGWSIAPYEPNFSMYRLKQDVNVKRKNTPTTLKKDSFVYKANTYYKTTITYADDISAKYVTRISPTIRASKTDIVVKQNPSPSAKTLFTLPANTAVESYGTLPGSWRIIRYGDVIGFVSAKPLEAVKASTQYVKLHGLPLRDIPSNSASARISNFLQQGIAVTVYASSNGWSYVTVGELGGYVPTSMLSAKKVAYTKTREERLPIDMTILQRFIVKTEKGRNGGKTVYKHTLRTFDAFTTSYAPAPTAIQYADESLAYVSTATAEFNQVQAAMTINKKYGTTYTAGCPTNDVYYFYDGASYYSNLVLCYEQNGKYVPFVESLHNEKPLYQYAGNFIFTFDANDELRVYYEYPDTHHNLISYTLLLVFNHQTKRFQYQ